MPSTLQFHYTTSKGARGMNQHERVNGERMSLELRHEHIGEILYEYAMVSLSGSPPGLEWQPLQVHLAACDECRSELQELHEILHDTYSGALEPTSPADDPDLSFLPQPAQATLESAQSAVRGALNLTRHVIIEFTQSLIDALRRPMLAGSYRGAHYCSYEHPHQSGDVQVSIDISITDESRKLCRVLVCVAHPARPFDLAGSQVTLRFGTFTREATTDHQGFAPFENIPLEFIPQLQFTILPLPSD